MISLRLPYPPTVNHYWGHRVARGKVVAYLTAAAREYRTALTASLLSQGWRPCQRLSGPLTVGIRAFPPDARRRDLDNLHKGLLDALQHAGVYEDDYQVHALYIDRGPVYPPAGLIAVNLTPQTE